MPERRRGFPLRRLVTLSVGLLAVMGAVWYFYPSSAEEDESVVEKVRDLVWSCPNCGLEMTCPPEDAAKKMLCPRCIAQRILMIARDRHESKFGSLLQPGSPVSPLILLGITLLLALTLLALRQRPAPQPVKRVVRLSSYPCPACGHRMNYSSSEVGRKATCPACAEQVVYPAMKEAVSLSEEQQDVARWMTRARRSRQGRKAN
jgi:predicted RNA-binding Zn-ribbon protein involved in translation (DUF1610 family)